MIAPPEGTNQPEIQAVQNTCQAKLHFAAKSFPQEVNNIFHKSVVMTELSLLMKYS